MTEPLLHYFNLIVTTYRLGERKAKRDLLDLLKKLGDENADCEMTGIDGVLIAVTKLDPLGVVEKSKELVVSEPWGFRNIFRIVPIESVVSTDINDIKNAALALVSERIQPPDTFRVTVEKRRSPIPSLDIIMAVADQIDNKVDLENPSWIVLVEIIEKVTGLSVLRPNQIFSSVIEKRALTKVSTLMQPETE